MPNPQSISALLMWIRHQLVLLLPSIVDFDAEISDRAFDFGVAEQQLHGSQVSVASVDQSCVRLPERMGAEDQLTSLLGRLALRCATR
jgi:hypothetical protein